MTCELCRYTRKRAEAAEQENEKQHRELDKRTELMRAFKHQLVAAEQEAVRLRELLRDAYMHACNNDNVWRTRMQAAEQEAVALQAELEVERAVRAETQLTKVEEMARVSTVVVPKPEYDLLVAQVIATTDAIARAEAAEQKVETQRQALDGMQVEIDDRKQEVTRLRERVEGCYRKQQEVYELFEQEYDQRMAAEQRVAELTEALRDIAEYRPDPSKQYAGEWEIYQDIAAFARKRARVVVEEE